MKGFIKLLAARTVLLAAIFVFTATAVRAYPVKMTLTYDGRTREYNAESIELYVDGKSIEPTLMPPVIIEGSTYVPSREVFEPLGAVVDWKETARELYIGYNNTLIVLKPGSDVAEINGEIIPLVTPAKIINNKLMIPVRFVAESLGIPVEWNGETRTVSIGNAQNITESEPQPQSPPLSAPEAAPASEDVSVEGQAVDISPEPLSEVAGALVSVTGFKSEGAVFTAMASGPITKVEKLILPENKLVLDIYNSENALSQISYPSGGFAGVTAVRNSQFQVTPVKITRLVFDLSGSNRFSVSFGEGRKSVVVAFEENTVTGIEYRSLDVGEQIIVTASIAPVLSASRIFSPERLVFDIPGARYAADAAELPVNGRFTNKIRASQFDGQTVRIVLDLNESPQFKVDCEENKAIITLTEPSYKNIGYEQEPQSVVTLKDAHIEPSDVKHTDNYLNGSYILTLPGDYSAYFGSGEFEINDGVIKSVAVDNSGGNTRITLNQKAIYAYDIKNESGNLTIKPVNPKSMYKNVVYIDAGHGNGDPGAEGNGFQEKNLNLSIVLYLHELLEIDSEIKVYASRMEDTYPQNIDRALEANHCADLFVSVHHNSAETSKSNGTEVLYLNHEGEVYPRISSEAVARIFQTNLVSALGTTDRGVVKRPNLIVLNQTKIPAVIVEVIFVSNKDDINKVSTPEGRMVVAESLYKSITEIFKQYPTGR